MVRSSGYFSFQDSLITLLVSAVLVFTFVPERAASQDSSTVSPSADQPVVESDTVETESAPVDLHERPKMKIVLSTAEMKKSIENGQPIATPKSEVRSGDTVYTGNFLFSQIEPISEGPVYFYAFSINGEEEFSQLAPMCESNPLMLDPGKAVTIPAGGDGIWQVTGKSGVEDLYFFISNDRWEELEKILCQVFSSSIEIEFDDVNVPGSPAGGGPGEANPITESEVSSGNGDPDPPIDGPEGSGQPGQGGDGKVAEKPPVSESEGKGESKNDSEVQPGTGETEVVSTEDPNHNSRPSGSGDGATTAEETEPNSEPEPVIEVTDQNDEQVAKVPQHNPTSNTPGQGGSDAVLFPRQQARDSENRGFLPGTRGLPTFLDPILRDIEEKSPESASAHGDTTRTRDIRWIVPKDGGKVVVGPSGVELMSQIVDSPGSGRAVLHIQLIHEEPLKQEIGVIDPGSNEKADDK